MERSGDPLGTGAAAWQEAAQAAARNWSGDLTVVYLGVDLVQTLEYVMATQVNQAYLADLPKGDSSE